jgi:polysaccharide export outer membrane protein
MKATTALATLLLFPCAGCGWSLHRSDHYAMPGSSGADPAAAPDRGADYRIAVDDVLHIGVWKEPELTTTVPVRTDGKISLSLLNDVQAAGLTPMALSAYLTTQLKKYLDDPRVTVTVAQMNHERIYLVGEVSRRGTMYLLQDMTVLQALAAAGLTQFANPKKIYVLRSVDGVERKFPVNYKRLLKGEGMNQNIKLKAGDTIIVP